MIDFSWEHLKSTSEIWARTPIKNRAQILSHAGEFLHAKQHDIFRCLREDGLSDVLAKRYAPWVLAQSEEARLLIAARDMIDVKRLTTTFEISIRRADGIVALVTPGNSPTINAGTLFPILLAGNGVLIRAPEHDAGVHLVIDSAIRPALREYGLPDGLVQVFTGKSREFLDALWDKSAVNTIVFFGNAKTGASVLSQAAIHQKKTILELEGSDWCLVWKDADVTNAIASASRAFDFSTQPCPIPKKFLVHDAVYDDFVSGLVHAARNAFRTIENDRSLGILTPVLRLDDFEKSLHDAVARGGEILIGGYRMNASLERDPAGVYVAPTVVSLRADSVHLDKCLLLHDEIGYPLIPVFRLSSNDEIAQTQIEHRISRDPFGLRFSMWSDDGALIERLSASVQRTGLFLVNNEHSMIPEFASPWGGPGRSGGPFGESHAFWKKTSREQVLIFECTQRELARRSLVSLWGDTDHPGLEIL